MTVDDSWKTPALREAQAQLAAAVERGQAAVERARQVAATVKPPRISDDDIAQIDRAARGKDAPPELRELARRVERGELTWRQIVDGHAMSDPGVQAAMRANLTRLGQVYRKFEDGYSLDEVLESEGVSAAPLQERPRRAAAPTPAGDEPEPTVLRDSSW